MIYGYLRVSSSEQDINSQKQGVDEYAKDKGWVIDEYVVDDGVSGGVDYAKRHLGELLNQMEAGDILISSEISRLGRNLLMVMEILNKVMKLGGEIHTVKEGYHMGNDIQSKVLAFAFGLASEIERQLIQQRTLEGLALRKKMGVLLGRPPRKNSGTFTNAKHVEEKKDTIVTLYRYGVSINEIYRVTGIDRATISRSLVLWKVHKNWEQLYDARQKRWEEEMERKRLLSEAPEIDTNRLKVLIESNMTLPEIAATMPEYTYDQVYYTVQGSRELHLLYRDHGHKRLAKEANKINKLLKDEWENAKASV
ncbi:recombinase family protein [Porphyromonadaceae bacterium W3.11]|nr:recombinase family protein [Porphyromonadaceae bacterium W3.11]MDN4753646.1 recombinase family protein [Porphyromonadaceae bacterium W3.11]MDN4753898.1 recombinase family protein [Porphyromonadaceae bacterium W3.11]MDN4755010.1 recombinase family protein [Porphyromonadaceae bacterium W3.11]